MSRKTIIRRTLDAVMTVISVFLMGGVFLFPSDSVHEILGTVLIVLWILHNILNRSFYKSLFKGKYSTTWIILTAVNAALAVSCVLLAISGIMLSNRVFLFLRIERGMGFARKAHLAASHWYFILIAFHFAPAYGNTVRQNNSTRRQADCNALRRLCGIVIRRGCVRPSRLVEIPFFDAGIFLFRHATRFCLVYARLHLHVRAVRHGHKNRSIICKKTQNPPNLNAYKNHKFYYQGTSACGGRVFRNFAVATASSLRFGGRLRRCSIPLCVHKRRKLQRTFAV